ncbi:serine-rich protein [Ruminococcus albus]|uniref:serine-rich protein n=1 Tax=Ruminococcus albus TaxID=1264 RepID=UPI00046305DB|nr:serine-rich protein [Ruminococcus albus]
MALTVFDIKRILQPKISTMPSDDFRIIDSWVEVDENSSKSVPKRPIKYLCFKIEVINPGSGEKNTIYKALKFYRVKRLPKSSKESKTFMDMHSQVLAALYENEINFVTIIANIMDPPLGLLFLYGVQGVSKDLEEAKMIADTDYVSLGAALQGTYKVLHMSHIEQQETEWLRQKMFNMEYLTAVRGIPKANSLGVSVSKTTMDNKPQNPDGTGTLEEIILGMSDYEYVIQILSTPVKMDTLTAWSMANQMNMTEWNEQLQGTKSLNFSLSIPMMYMANTSNSKGWNQAYSDSSTLSHGTGQSFNTGYGENLSNGLSMNYGQAIGQSSGHSFSNTISNTESISQSVSHGQSLTHSVGESLGLSQGHTQGLTQGVSENFGHNTSNSLNHSISNNVSNSFGLSQNHGYSHGNSVNIGESINQSAGISEGYGASISQNSSHSLNHGSSINSSISQSQGFSQSQSYNQSLGQSSSMSNSISSGRSMNFGHGESWNEGQNYSHGNSLTSSEGQSYGHSANSGSSWNNSEGFSDGWSHGSSMNSGTSSGSSVSSGSSENSGLSNSVSNNVSLGIGPVNSSGGDGQNFSSSSGYSSSTSENLGHSTGYGTSDSNNYGHNNSFSNGGSFSQGENWGASSSLSQGMSTSEGLSFGHGGSINESYGFNSSQSQGITNGTSFSQSIGTGQSLSSTQGISNGWGQSYSYGESSGMGVSQSQNQGFSQSYGSGSSFSQGDSQSISESVGTSQSQSVGSGESWGLGQSEGFSESMGYSRSASDSVSQSVTNSISNSDSFGRSISQSQGYSQGISKGMSLGETSSQSYTQNVSQGASMSTGSSKSVSQGQSISESNGRSLGQSMGTSGAFATSTGGSMGLGPSISYGKSYQWLDQQVKDILEILNYENERLKNALKGNGAFYTDVYIACTSQDALAAAKALAKSSWQNDQALRMPIQVLDLESEEQRHLLYHFSAFSADITRTSVYGVSEYKYTTVLLPSELVAYTHPPRASEGGIYSDVNDVPKFAVPSMMQGEIYMGTILSAERWTINNGYKTPFDYRIDESMLMHGYFTGQSRSGKTVAAMRFIAELSRARRKQTGKRFRIVCMDPKSDWRSLARFVEPERFNFYSLGNPNFHPIHFNPCKIPYGVFPQKWVDGLIEIFCRAYGLLERGKQIMAETIFALYRKAGVFDALDDPNWKDVVPELSKKVTFKKIYKHMESCKIALDDSSNPKGRAGNDTRDAYSRILERLSCFGREYSIESKLFGEEDGMGIDDLIGDDDITVLESSGLESTFSNFIFGVITSGFYQYGKAQEGGYKAPDQYETILVIEEANKVLTGNDTAGTGGGSSLSLGGQSEFEEILDQSAGYGLFVIAITQKIADMPSSIMANAGLVFAGRLKRVEDINVVIRTIAREEKFEDRDIVKWFPRSPTGWFICQTSRGYDFLDAEPVLVNIAPLNFDPPTNDEIDEVLTRKKIDIMLRNNARNDALDHSQISVTV